VHNRRWVEQNMIRNFEFRLTEEMTRLGNVLQQVHRFRLGIWLANPSSTPH
jgi:hypothetical protein